MKGKLSKVLAFALIASLLAVPIIGCAKAPEPKPTPTPTPTGKKVMDEKLHVVGLWDLTGPISSTVLPITDVHAQYEDYVNEEKGGIWSEADQAYVKWEWRYRDTGYKIPNTLAGYKFFKDWGMHGLVLWSTPEAEALREFVDKDQIPTTTGGASAKCFDPPGYEYIDMITYVISFHALVDWLMNEGGWDYMKGELGITEDRAPRMGFLTWDSAWGKTLNNEVEWAKGQGVDFVGIEYVPYRPLDMSPEITRLRDSGVDILVHMFTAAVVGLTAEQLVTMGLKGKIAQFGPCSSVGESELLSTASPEAAEGIFFPSSFFLWEEDTKGIKFAHELAELNNYTVKDTYTYIRGLNCTMIWEEVFRLALEKVSIKDLSGKDVKEYGFDRLQHFETGLEKDIGYGPDRRSGTLSMRVVRHTNGLNKPVSDWLEGPNLLK